MNSIYINMNKNILLIATVLSNLRFVPKVPNITKKNYFSLMEELCERPQLVFDSGRESMP